jgi:hypothetical protein
MLHLNASGRYAFRQKEYKPMNAGVLITLPNTHQVFKALDNVNELLEETGLKKEFKAETIAAPREITAQCGVSLLCAPCVSPVWLGSSAWKSPIAEDAEKRSCLEQDNALLFEKIRKKRIIKHGEHSKIYIIEMDFNKKTKKYVETEILD